MPVQSIVHTSRIKLHVHREEIEFELSLPKDFSALLQNNQIGSSYVFAHRVKNANMKYT